MRLKTVAFDWGHTVMDERKDRDVPLDIRPIHVMPGVVHALERIHLPLALWANTCGAAQADVRAWLERAAMSHFFRWVITSVDAGARKPAPEFFRYALNQCGLDKDEVLFVGNQMNTDIAGAESFGIATVWLAGAGYRSEDDGPSDSAPTYTITTLDDLPPLLQRVVER
jgi:FMN phosphatase YigB (HAD superfamily)